MTMAFARKRAGLLQRQVAEALGVSMGAVAMWDTGRNMPRADMLPKIAKLYNCGRAAAGGRTQKSRLERRQICK